MLYYYYVMVINKYNRKDNIMTDKKKDIQDKTWISVQEEAQSEKKSMGRKLKLIESFSIMQKQGILSVDNYMPKGSNKHFNDLFKDNKTITNSMQLMFLERVIVKALGKNTDDFKVKYPLEFNVLREITPSVIMVIREDCFKYDDKKQCFTQPKNPNKPLEVNLKKELFQTNNLLEDKFKTDGKDIWVHFRSTVDKQASLKEIADFYLKDRNEQKQIIVKETEQTATDTPINLAVERALNSAQKNSKLSDGNPTIMSKELTGIKNLIIQHIDNLAESNQPKAFQIIVDLQGYITSVIYNNSELSKYYNGITRKYKVDMDLRPHHKGRPITLKTGETMKYIQGYNS